MLNLLAHTGATSDGWTIAACIASVAMAVLTPLSIFLVWLQIKNAIAESKRSNALLEFDAAYRPWSKHLELSAQSPETKIVPEPSTVTDNHSRIRHLAHAQFFGMVDKWLYSISDERYHDFVKQIDDDMISCDELKAWIHLISAYGKSDSFWESWVTLSTFYYERSSKLMSYVSGKQNSEREPLKKTHGEVSA